MNGPVTALNFNTPTVGATAAALDGNAAANRQTLSNVLLSGAAVYPGQEIFFRWYDTNDSGNDHGVAVDDLSITFTTVTAVSNPPAIPLAGQPQSRTNNAGTDATFTVSATGTAPYYQWRKDGNDLSDGGNIFGATTPSLLVSNVLVADAAGYTVLVTNSVGSVTSSVAKLTIIDPAINTQPVSQTVVAGDTGNFFVGAAGTALLTYQWRHGGMDIPGANVSSLDVGNAQSGDQGAYTVVVSGGTGQSVTSSPANLTLLATPANRLARWDVHVHPRLHRGTGHRSARDKVVLTVLTTTLNHLQFGEVSHGSGLAITLVECKRFFSHLLS